MDEEVMDEDLEFIKDPNRWPRWPFLPLKKAGALAYMVNTTLEGEPEPIVYLGLMYDHGKRPVATLGYSDLAAIVADGWMVD